jgi:hypothetical protein
MELDATRPWRIVTRGNRGTEAGEAYPDPAATDTPLDFAAAELAAVLGRITGSPFLRSRGFERDHLILLDLGEGKAGSAAGFTWRASHEWVEIYGDDPRGLLRAVYDFLSALGAAWIAPGEGGERLPKGRLDLRRAAGTSAGRLCGSTLILGHGSYLERYEDYLPWAARNGYSSVFFHTSNDALTIGSAPAALYESLRTGIAPMALRMGLEIELGGHLLTSFLPRSFFKTEPELFRMKEGRRLADRNLCASNPRALDLAASGFLRFAEAHPEVEVFHAWPDDLPGGGWCSCPACSSEGGTRTPGAQSLRVAMRLAAALAEADSALGRKKPRRLSFLAYHDTEDSLTDGPGLGSIAANLELLWAPRRRCWAHGYGDASCAVNAGSIGGFRRSARAWKAAGGGRVTVFEYWEDALLFKAALPALAATLEGDVEAYAGAGKALEERADALGVLCTGGRVPLAPRPNLWLLPRLALGAGSEAGAVFAEWVEAAYGGAAAPMRLYWAALEAAWKIDLEIEPGDTGLSDFHEVAKMVDEPIIDWGDPWSASLARLTRRRDRCEELFDRLREAEKSLAAATELATAATELATAGVAEPWAAAVHLEAKEYLISGSLLELDCARLAVYQEYASGDTRAAADVALLAGSTLSALYRTLGGLPDRRSRADLKLLLFVYYGLRLRAVRRAASRNPLGRALDRAACFVELVVRALPVLNAWAPRGGITSRHCVRRR